MYFSIREKLENKFKFKTAGTVDTLDLLYSDFLSNITYVHNNERADDFLCQFKYVLYVIDKQLEYCDDKQSETFLRFFENVMNNLKQQIFHMGQSNRAFIEIPTSHLRYTGQLDQLLHAYYGMSKSILKIAYSLQHENKQSRLIPLITIDVVPIVNSEIYSTPDKTKIDDEKILLLRIPGNLLCNLPRGYCFLAHEIFHYIAPINRQKRNIRIGVILLSKIMKIYFMDIFIPILKDCIEDKNISNDIGKLKEIINNVYYKYEDVIKSEIAKRYENIDLEILNKLMQENSMKEEVSLLWSVYSKEFEAQMQDHCYNILKDLLAQIMEEFKKEYCIKTEISLEKLDSVLFEYHQKFRFSESERIWIKKIKEGISEALVDISMIESMGMDYADYLFFYLQVLGDTGVLHNKDNNIELNTVDYIRLGIIERYFAMTMKNPVNEKIFATVNRYISNIYGENNILKEEELKSLLERVNNNYKFELGNYEDIVIALIEDTRLEKRGCDKQIVETCQQYMNVYRTALQGNNFTSEFYNLNVKIAQGNKIQERIEDLSVREKSISNNDFNIYHDIVGKNKKYYEIDPRWEFKVYNSGQFMDVLQWITKKLKVDFSNQIPTSCPIWYRGEKNADFHLEPSIMRDYKNNYKTNKALYGTMARYQRKMYENFRAYSDGSQEFKERGTYTLSDYIAIMQHYSVPTNFLDWTENFDTALYFSLEEKIDPDLKEKSNIGRDKDVSFYVFNPIAYNFIRGKLLESKNVVRDSDLYSKYVFQNKLFGGYLPNLSIKENEKLLSMFLLGDTDDTLRIPDTPNITLDLNQGLISMPLAILTSKLNLRIRVQNGMFLAYNLYTVLNHDDIDNWEELIPTKNDVFHYICLENVQKYYFDNKVNVEGFSYKPPFLYKVIIDSNTVESMGDWLINLGGSTEKIYPELKNIGLRIKNSK